MARQFEVSIANTFDAEDIHDAVEQFVEWIANCGEISGFRVEDVDNNTEYLYDTPRNVIPLGAPRIY